jgi:bifunctional DNase/RNase
MWLEMKVKGLALDPLSNMPIIILRDEEEKRSLPIWVGLFEANAIALELEKISPPRPMTHDLIKNILESLDTRVQKIVVTDVRDNTFYAVIHLRLGTADITVDSRPSDAIALALRVGAPIFVERRRLCIRPGPSRWPRRPRSAPGRATIPPRSRSGSSRSSRTTSTGSSAAKTPTARTSSGGVVGLLTNNYLEEQPGRDAPEAREGPRRAGAGAAGRMMHER